MRAGSTRRRLAAVLAAASALAIAASARAQDIGDVPTSAEPRLDARDVIGAPRPYWSAGKPRWFAAAVFDVGAINLRPELDLGWGRPHFAWVGLELTPQISLAGASTFAGARVTIPGISLRGGARYLASGDRYLLEPREVYNRDHVDLEVGPRSRYLAVEGELTLDIPLPAGALSTATSIHYLTEIPDPYFVFEQSLRVVVDPPLAWRSRTAYLVGLGKFETASIGGLVEFIGVPKRDEVMVRVGPAFSVSLTHHLEAIAAASLPIESKDELGLESADFGQISLRYRWATGDRWPEFP